MKLLLSVYLLFSIIAQIVATATLGFGNATLQSPHVSLTASEDEGRLVQTIRWTVQTASCEVLTRTDDSMIMRARLVSLTSTCIHRNVCNGRHAPLETPIPCEDFMRRIN